MYVRGISNAREIMWSKVASHFDGATPIFLCKVFYYLVQECRKDIGDENFVGKTILDCVILNICV